MMHLLGSRVMVAVPPQPAETTSQGGLVLLAALDRFYTPTRGIVVQLGRKSHTCDLHEVRAAVRTWCEDRALQRVGAAGTDIDRRLRQMAPAAFDVQIGDCVIFSASAGQQVSLEGTEYVILDEREIIGVVEPQKVAAA